MKRLEKFTRRKIIAKGDYVRVARASESLCSNFHSMYPETAGTTVLDYVGRVVRVIEHYNNRGDVLLVLFSFGDLWLESGAKKATGVKKATDLEILEAKLLGL